MSSNSGKSREHIHLPCIFCVVFWFIAYPHVGCFTAVSIRRYFNRQLTLSVSQKGEDDVMRCFKAARAENYNIFAVRKPRKKSVQCWTGRDAEENLETYQEGSGCKNGLGGQKVFDIFLVLGRAISEEHFPKSDIWVRAAQKGIVFKRRLYNT